MGVNVTQLKLLHMKMETKIFIACCLNIFSYLCTWDLHCSVRSGQSYGLFYIESLDDDDDDAVLDRPRWTSDSAHSQRGHHVVVPARPLLPARRSGHLDVGVLRLCLHHGGGVATRGSFCALHQVWTFTEACSHHFSHFFHFKCLSSLKCY